MSRGLGLDLTLLLNIPVYDYCNVNALVCSFLWFLCPSLDWSISVALGALAELFLELPLHLWCVPNQDCQQVECISTDGQQCCFEREPKAVFARAQQILSQFGTDLQDSREAGLGWISPQSDTAQGPGTKEKGKEELNQMSISN